MARNAFGGISGISDNLLNGELLGELPIKDFETLISEVNEFTKSANEATEAYKRMISEGLKPTAAQLKEIKKIQADSEKLAKAQARAREKASMYTGKDKERATKLADSLKEATSASLTRNSWAKSFSYNKDTKFIEENKKRLLAYQAKTEKQSAKESPMLAPQAESAQENAEKIEESAKEAKASIEDIGKTETQNNNEILPVSQVQQQAESLEGTCQKVKESIKDATNSPLGSKENPIMLSDAIEESRNRLLGFVEEYRRTLQFNTKTGEFTGDEALKAQIDEEKAKLNELLEIRSQFEKKGETTKESKATNESEERKEIGSYEELLYAIESVKKAREELANKVYSGNSENYQEDIATLQQYDKVLKELEGQKNRVEKNVTPQSTEEEQDNEAIIHSYQELLQMIELVRNAKDELAKKITSGRSDNFEEDSAKLQEYEKALKELEALKSKIDKATPQKATETTEEEEKHTMSLIGLLRETISVKSQLAGQKMALFGTSDVEGTQANIKSLNDRLKNLKAIWSSVSSSPLVSAFNSIKSAAGSAIQSVGSKLWGSIKSGASSALSSITNLASRGFGTLKSAVSTTLGNMQKLVSGGFNAVKTGANAVKSAFQSVRGAMTSLVKKSTPNLMKSFGSLKSMLMRRIKRTFISSIFNQAKEGLQQLAKHSAEFNKSMSNIKNSAKQVAGNMSVSLGNLVNLVAPALQTLLGWLNQVLVAFNSLFAVLSGKGKITVAKQSTDDYAKSLKNASGAAKDLNHQLYGFDEITRQEDDNGSGGGSKIGYEEQAVSDMFKDIKDMFEKGQFFEIGQLIGNKLNEIVLKIDNWINEIRPKAVQWTKNIAEILNGIIDTDLFASLGKTIGDGLNLIFDIFNTFLTSFHFDVLGEKLADGVNNLFEAIEWELVGETIINYFNAIWQMLGNFFESLNWEAIGHDLADAVHAIFDNIDWDSFKQMWSEGINGVFNTVYTLFADIDFGVIAKDIDNNFMDLINNKIQWGMIENALSAMLKDVLDVFHVLVNSNFFTSLASKLGKLVGGVLNNINWNQLVSDIVIGIGELRGAFWAFINRLNIEDLASKLSGAINGLMTNDNVQKAWDDADKKATEGLNKIVNAFAKLVGPVSGGGIDFDGIASTIGTRVGKFLDKIEWEKLVTSIGTGITKIVGAFGTLVSKLNLGLKAKRIASGINNFFSQKGEDGKPILETAAGKAGEGVQSIIGAFTTFISDLDLGTISSSIAGSIQSFFSEIDFADALTRIGTFVTEASSEFFKLVARVFTGTDEEGNKIGETLGEQLAKGLNGIFKKEDGTIDTEQFKNLGQNLGDAIKGLFNDIATFFDETDWEAIGEAIGTAIANIDWLGIAESLLRLLYNALIAASNIFGGAIANIVNALLGIDTEGVREQMQEDYVNLATNTAQDFVDAVATAFGGVKNSKEAKDAIIEAYANWANVSPEEAQALFSENAEDMAANVLYITKDELIAKLSTKEGYEEVKQKLAETLGITMEQASEMLSNYEIAKKLSDTLGMAWDEAISYSEGNVESNATRLANIYGISYEEALSLLGQQGYAQMLADALGVSYEDAVALLENQENFDALSELFADGAESAKDKIMEGLYEHSESEETVKEYFKSLGIDLTDEMVKSFVGAKPKIMSSNRNLLYSLIDDETVEEVKQTFKAYGIKISDEFAEAITGQGMDDIDAALALLGEGVNESTLSAFDMANISENLTHFMETTGRSLGEVAEILMSDNKEELANIARELGIEVGDDLGNVTPEALKKALLEGKKSVQEAADELASIADQTENKANMEVNATGAAEGVNSALSNELKDNTDVSEAAQGTADAVKEKYEALPDEVKPYAESMMEYITTAMVDKNSTLLEPAIQSIVDNIIEKISNTLSSDKGAEIAREFITGMETGVNDEKGNYINLVNDTAMDSVTNAKAYLNYSNGYNMGQNMILGMYNGFSSYGQDLVNFIADVCSVCEQTAKDILGIRSPSKVFAEIGEYTMEGMQIGLEREGKNAIGTVADVANAITGEGENSSFNIMGNGLDNVADKLERVANIFSDIADTITQMGSLEIPTIATGQVIPYKAKVDDTLVQTNSPFETRDVEDALYRAFTRAIGDGDGQQAINITLMIDGRKLTDIVTKYQRQQNRAWGV